MEHQHPNSCMYSTAVITRPGEVPGARSDGKRCFLRSMAVSESLPLCPPPYSILAEKDAMKYPTPFSAVHLYSFQPRHTAPHNSLWKIKRFFYSLPTKDVLASPKSGCWWLGLGFAGLAFFLLHILCPLDFKWASHSLAPRNTLPRHTSQV